MIKIDGGGSELLRGAPAIAKERGGIAVAAAECARPGGDRFGTASDPGENLRRADAEAGSAGRAMQARCNTAECVLAPAELLQHANLVEQELGVFGTERTRLGEVRRAFGQASDEVGGAAQGLIDLEDYDVRVDFVGPQRQAIQLADGVAEQAGVLVILR